MKEKSSEFVEPIVYYSVRCRHIDLSLYVL